MSRSVLVYTSGVFDIFHAGHLNMLRYAKGLGDKLIVGVSVDELVMEYKNKMPKVSFDERMAIVCAIRYVDVGIPQLIRDKHEVWKKIGFDIWVVGDDWYDDAYYMEIKNKLEQEGVRTVFMPHTTGISSTQRWEKSKA